MTPKALLGVSVLAWLLSAPLAGQHLVRRYPLEPPGDPETVALRLDLPRSDDGQVLYGVTSGGIVYIVESYRSAPQATLLGNPGLNFLDIAWDDRTQTLYGITRDGLYTIDLNVPITAHLVGDPEIGFYNSLEFDSAGRLFTWDVPLVELDPETALATEIGDTGFDSEGDLAFDANLSLLYGASQTGLITIDPETAASEWIAPLSFDAVFGLELDDEGTLIAGAAGGTLYEVDPDTGDFEQIGPIEGVTSVHGLALARGKPCSLSVEIVSRSPAVEELVFDVELHHGRARPVSVPLVVWLEDAQGEVVLRQESAFVTLAPGATLTERFTLALESGLAAGDYRLVVGVDQMEQGIAWVAAPVRLE